MTDCYDLHRNCTNTAPPHHTTTTITTTTTTPHYPLTSCTIASGSIKLKLNLLSTASALIHAGLAANILSSVGIFLVVANISSILSAGIPGWSRIGSANTSLFGLLDAGKREYRAAAILDPMETPAMTS